MSVSPFESHEAKPIKDLSDAIRRLNNAKKFSTLHKVNQLETIREYSTYGVGPPQTFLRDRNTPDDYIPLYEAYPETLAPLREAIEEIQLPQELFFPLIRTTSTVRRKILWDMENGAAYSDLKLEHKIQEHFENRKSDNDLMLDRGEREALDKLHSRYAREREELLQKSKQLYRLMCDHLAFWECMPRDWRKYEILSARAPKRIAAQELKREEIIKLAAATQQLFETYHGCTEFAEMRNWMHVAIDDPTAMYIASAHYSLRQLADGNFQDHFPSVASRYSYWSALGSIARLAGAQSRKLSRVPRYNRKLVMKLDAVSLWAGGGGQALGLETAGFRVRKLYERDDLCVETLTKNRHEWDVDTGVDWTSLPKKLDIMTAAMTLKHWSNKGKGADAEGTQLRQFKEAVLLAKPRSFFSKRILRS